MGEVGIGEEGEAEGVGEVGVGVNGGLSAKFPVDLALVIPGINTSFSFLDDDDEVH